MSKEVLTLCDTVFLRYMRHLRKFALYLFMFSVQLNTHMHSETGIICKLG
jgi:hypothetical protein